MNKDSILKASGELQPQRVYKVDLTNHKITSVAAVKEFDKLRCVILSYNMIERIDNLNCYLDLRELHLQSNAIERLGGLEANKVLQVLNLRNNHIEKIENIAHLVKLQTLILDNNQLSKISGLEYLKDLKHLYASHNRIESVENLPAFSKLQNFNLSHNKIKQIQAHLFSSSKNLVMLNLSHNRIESTTFLQQLLNLQSLNLCHNRIKELQVSSLPSLQSLNLSDNELQTLPPIKTVFPQLVSMDVSHNLICCQMQILSSLAQAEYLTEFDCRQNPMSTESFESGLQKIHSFDFLNGKTMTKAGAKYYDRINMIQLDLSTNREYQEDDQKDRQLKMSGFHSDELQFQMTGLKVNRPSSPNKRKKIIEKPTFYDDIGRTYSQFMENDRKIKVIRQHYLKICGDYNIKSSNHILTQLPPETAELISNQNSFDEKPRQSESKKQISQQLINSENEIRKENQKNLNKWKELKQREKSFNIREVIKKSRGKDNSVSRGINSTTNSNWGGSTGMKTQKMKSQLLRTQAVPRKVGEEVLKSIARPRSVRKKE